MYVRYRELILIILCTRQQRKHRQKEQSLDSVGEEEDGIIWENSIETYITICKRDSQWEFDVWCRAPKDSALWQPGGVRWGGRWEGGFRREGTHIYLWPIHIESESRSVVSNSLQPHELYRVHGILQARMMEWITVPFSRVFSQPRDGTQVSHIAGGFLIYGKNHHNAVK